MLILNQLLNQNLLVFLMFFDRLTIKVFTFHVVPAECLLFFSETIFVASEQGATHYYYII